MVDQNLASIAKEVINEALDKLSKMQKLNLSVGINLKNFLFFGDYPFFYRQLTMFTAVRFAWNCWFCHKNKIIIPRMSIGHLQPLILGTNEDALISFLIVLF